MPHSVTPKAINEDIAQIRRLRVASFAEASTLLILLLVAVPLKYGLGYSWGTRIMGPVHGAAFIAYAWNTVAAISGSDWSGREVARLILAAFIPFGGFLNAGLLRRKQAIIAVGIESQR